MQKTASAKNCSRDSFRKRLGFESLEDRRLLSIGVGDFVWNDLNSNGSQDAGEPGLAGIAVELHGSADGVVGNADDALLAQTVTDDAGHYSFNDLSDGVNYYLTFRTPGCYSFTSKNAGGDNALDSDANTNGTTDIFTLSTDQFDAGRDAGLKGSAPSFGWSSAAGGAGDECGRSVAADATGNVYVAGTFSGTADFDPGPGVYNLTPNGGTNVFMAKYSPAGSLLWAKGLSGGNFDSRCQIALDGSGNVYATGAFGGTADFDPGLAAHPLSSFGGADIFVEKLGPQGNFVWARQMGGAADDYGASIDVAGDGSVLTTGSFQATADFDPGGDAYNLMSWNDYGPADIFVSKLNADGNFVWAKQFGGNADDYGTAIAAADDGGIYATGSFQNSADFDPGPESYSLSSLGGSDIFIAKLDAGGNLLWAKQIGSTEFDSSNALALDGGSVYTTGYFRETADFDPGAGVFNLTTAGSRDIFVSKLDSAGNFLWAKKMGSTSTDTAYAIAVDDFGGVYTTGFFQGTADFDPGTSANNLASAGGEDIFVSKLTNAGNFLWAKRFGGTVFDSGYSVAVRYNTEVYVTGYYQGIVDFDPGAGVYNMANAGGLDAFTSTLTFYPPTDIQLSAATVPEHQPIGTVVGLLTATDPDPAATLTYFFASGTGAEDNARFTISGNQLKTNACFDFETKSAFSVRIACVNNKGASFTKSFVVTVTDAAEMSIGGRAWKDANENGIQDTGETGMEGVKVRLYYSPNTNVGDSDDQLMGETTTDALGRCLFHEVSYGMNYYLMFIPTAPNLAFTGQDIGSDDASDSDANSKGNTKIFTLTQGQQDGTRDAGLIGTSLIGDWADRIGGVSAKKCTALATDRQGNVYATGYFSGTVNFDPGPGTYNLSSAGGNDIFVAKYSPTGTLLWADRLGGASNDSAASIAVADYGYVYLTGFFSATADFDPGSGTYNLTSVGNADIFVAIIYNDGASGYAMQMGGSGLDQGLSIALDNDYGFVVAGTFSGTANFARSGIPATNLTSAGDVDSFVFKYDSSWNLAWARRMGGTGADQCTSMALGSDGSVLTTGSFNGTVDFDPGNGVFNLTSAGNTDVFLSKLDSGGNFVWARRLGGASLDQGTSIAVASDGGVLASGYFNSVVDFDPGDGVFNMTSAGNADIFITKLDAGGNFVWARRMGSAGMDQCNSLALGSNGCILTTGFFNGTVDFDPGGGVFNLTSAGSADAFISKSDAAGNFLGAWHIGGAALDMGIALIADGQGGLWTSGTFSGMADFNLGPDKSYLTSIGSPDVYLAKYALNPPTDIRLSADSIQENLPVGSVVGALSTVDAANWSAFAYSLVPGGGDADNGLFLIEGNQLKATAIFDFETKSSYSIRLRTVDCGGQWYEKNLLIGIVDQNDPPATRIWNGCGADNLWSTPQNWLGGAAPLPGDILSFPIDALQKANVNDYASQTAFQSIEFAGAGYQLSGNSILLVSGLGDYAADASENLIALDSIVLFDPQSFVNLHNLGGLVVKSNIILGNHTLTFNDSGTMQIEGAISGQGGINKTGGGALNLTGKNNYYGTTKLTGGELHAGDILSKSTPTNSVIVQDGATLWATSIIADTLIIGGSSAANANTEVPPVHSLAVVAAATATPKDTAIVPATVPAYPEIFVGRAEQIEATGGEVANLPAPAARPKPVSASNIDDALHDMHECTLSVIAGLQPSLKGAIFPPAFAFSEVIRRFEEITSKKQRMDDVVEKSAQAAIHAETSSAVRDAIFRNSLSDLEPKWSSRMSPSEPMPQKKRVLIDSARQLNMDLLFPL